jgi:tRNA 2-selenouridine synthase
VFYLRAIALKHTPTQQPSYTISVADYLANPARFSCVLDARTPAEYALDHLPGAVSTPVLNDEQRVTIGTLDKQVGSFEAKRVGAGLVSANIGELLKTALFEQPRDWTPLVYCWRGGNRSGSLAHVLRKIGWPSMQLEGGYKAFRNHVIAQLETMPMQFNYRVIAGPTGAGKTRLLQALAAQGAQVLDLEAIACHRGSVLGAMLEPQPSQKAFETQVWQALKGFDTTKTVYVESESAKVGNVRVPEALIQAMRGSPCVVVQATLAQRVALLCEEYNHFVQNAATLNEQLARLAAHYGTDQIGQWQAQANAGDWAALVETLLVKHYDPAYEKSLGKNYAKIDEALGLNLRDISAPGFYALAHQTLTSA